MPIGKSTVKVPIGMRRSWFFPISAEPEGTKPTYGEKLDMGTAVKGYLSVTTASASVPGDDVTQVAYDTVFWYRFPLLKKAHARSEFHEEEGYEKFCMESWYWLNDYALYMALKFHFDNQEWLAWPEDIRFRKRDAVERYKDALTPAIILIPGKDGSLGIGMANVKRAVERAVGADIL